MKTNEKNQRLTKALRALSIAHGFIYDAMRSIKGVKKSLMTEAERALNSVSALFDMFDGEFRKLQEDGIFIRELPGFDGEKTKKKT